LRKLEKKISERWVNSAKEKIEVATLKGHENYVRSVAFSPDGKIIASSAYAEIKFWSVREKREIATLKGHDDSVRSIAFSPDGGILVSGSGDGTVKLWVKLNKGTKTAIGFCPSLNSLLLGRNDLA